MKLFFLGANRQVTGSRYCLEVSGKRILIDCGMFQERKFADRNWEPCPIEPSKIDVAVLTHAHIDHCGTFPRLVRDGFEGTIYATYPTVDLADIMLRDAAKIQMEDMKYKQKRHRRQKKTSPFPYEPLFDENDAIRTLSFLLGVDYNQSVPLTDQVSLQFFEAGHILGSASLELTVQTDAGQKRTLVFSGDVGQWHKPFLRDPDPKDHADYLILESTYGDRNHEIDKDVETQLDEIINRTVSRGGKVVIPTFAVERAQELMYHISALAHADRIPDVPIYLDSPMAVDVTDTFKKHRDAYDEATWQRIRDETPPLQFPGLHFTRSSADSRAINYVDGPAIIMSTSGMCTAGRIKHHLKTNITDSRNTILFVGFQAHGTLGRHIVDGSDRVRIHGREFEVHAEVERIYGFSGHADRDGLLHWAGTMKIPPKRTFLTHGEEESARSLAAALAQKGWSVEVPAYEAMVELE